MFHDMLIKMMDKHRLNNKALSSKSGLSEVKISRLLNKQREPTFSEVEKIMKAFDLNAMDMFYLSKDCDSCLDIYLSNFFIVRPMCFDKMRSYLVHTIEYRKETLCLKPEDFMVNGAVYIINVNHGAFWIDDNKYGVDSFVRLKSGAFKDSYFKFERNTSMTVFIIKEHIKIKDFYNTLKKYDDYLNT